MKEKIDDPDKFIKIDRLCSNQMNEKVIGIYSMRQAERDDYKRLSDIELESLSVITASDSGYLRLYALREKKLLECLA